MVTVHRDDKIQMELCEEEPCCGVVVMEPALNDRAVLVRFSNLCKFHEQFFSKDNAVFVLF